MERTKSNLENCLYPYNCTTRNSSILRFTGNIDYTNSNTAPTWTNKPNGLMPIESQQLQTNSSQQYINISDEFSPARVTYHPSTSAAGDTSTVNAKGSYSVINGSAPVINSTTLHSELFYHRNMTVNQNTIALSSDRGSLEIAGVSLLYEGSRVKSYLLGRDLNPMGRGDGSLYAQGMFSVGNTRPVPNASPIRGFGNSINNPGIGLAVDKEPEKEVGISIVGNSISITQDMGRGYKCKHCFEMIPMPRENCYLTIYKYGLNGHCTTHISCDCGVTKVIPPG